MTEPTDNELAKLFTEETGFDVDDFPAAILDFARAARQRWGQPAHSGEPVATVQTIHGVTVGYLETAVPAGTKLYTAPQPVGRVPLTHAQAKALVLKYGNDPLHLVYQVEVAHGIKGGQHGTE